MSSFPGCVTTTENSATSVVTTENSRTSVSTSRNHVCGMALFPYRIKEAMQSVANLYGTSKKIRLISGMISTVNLYGTSKKIIIQGGATM